MEGEQGVRVGLVTCPLFPKLTGDDRLLYRALVEALQPAAGGERKPAAPTTGQRAKSRPRAKAPSEDDPTSGPVHIVQWSDPGVDWASFRLCVIRSPWDYTQRQAEWLAWLDSTVDRTPPTGGGPVFLPDAATLRWNGHKRYLLDLERRGIPVVPTRLLERGQDFEKAADEIARKNEWGCEFFIVKPAVGSFGNDVTMIKLGGRDGDNVKVMKRMNQLLSGQDLLIQPFLASVKTKGEVSLIFIENEFVHAIKKKPTQGDFKIERHDATEEELKLGLVRHPRIHRSHLLPEPVLHRSATSGTDNEGVEEQSGGEADAVRADPRPGKARHHQPAKGKEKTLGGGGGAKEEKRPPRRTSGGGGSAGGGGDGHAEGRLLLARVDLLRENAGRLVVSEVEALDPELFFRLSDACALRLAQAIVHRRSHPRP
ncbi:uncharacterized protein ACA1_374540 [Acanthamoeba castellanii str. Neff]|uniref:Uncharacterized protein n=1 Tax=Acanthamoeba castellanii (strain ATCC 30010 / Neff) TaxID=1257118 RepID=L8GJL5_ACACF|nr:uncharacterized protein ACA1_374540 [Acanthamoeba castellanii str. Neff]ELR12386.1 hypothetical protein ACA1_374540 [Acanthamoeba castellanii str. Neff]